MTIELQKAAKHFSYYLSYQLNLPQQIKLTIAYAENYAEIVKAIIEQLSKNTDRFAFQFYLLTKPHEEILLAMEKSDLVLLLFDHFTRDNFSQEYPSFIQPFASFFSRNPLKLIFLTDIRQQFHQIYSIDPERIRNLNLDLISHATTANYMYVKNSLGTDLTIDLGVAEPWANSDGTTMGEILPSEIATYSPSINGRLVFTGALLCMIPFAVKHGLIQDPIYFDIENGVIKSFDTANKILMDDLNYFFDFNADHLNINEIGIGTNEGAKQLYGINASFEEKHPGLHFGLGGRDSNSFHLDIMLDHSEIYFDSRKIFDGQFYL